MKYLIIILIFFSTISNGQINAIGDKLNGNPKEYTETYFEAKKIKNKLVKGKRLFDNKFVLNEFNEFTMQSYFLVGKFDMPQKIYNDNNLLVELVEFYEDGTIMHKKKYKYNERNQKIEQLFYNSLDTLESKSVFKYENDLMVKLVTTTYFYDIKNTEEIKETFFVYDDKKNLISQTYNDGSTGIYVRVYKYNDKNNLIEIYNKNNFNPKESKLTLDEKIKYIKYDQFNWTAIFVEENLQSKRPNLYYLERVYKY